MSYGIYAKGVYGPRIITPGLKVLKDLRVNVLINDTIHIEFGTKLLNEVPEIKIHLEKVHRRAVRDDPMMKYFSSKDCTIPNKKGAGNVSSSATAMVVVDKDNIVPGWYYLNYIASWRSGDTSFTQKILIQKLPQ